MSRSNNHEVFATARQQLGQALRHGAIALIEHALIDELELWMVLPFLNQQQLVKQRLQLLSTWYLTHHPMIRFFD